VGRDVRTTSERLRAALIGGLTASGADVLDVGLVPTPVLYFAAFHRHTDGAVMITGSHNPPPDNGFKIMRGKQSLYGEEIRALRHIIEAGDYAAGGPGQVSSEDVIPTYLDHALGQLRLGERRCKVVVDAGNGMGGLTAGALYRRMGFDVTELYCEPDGSFPNHHPDPTVEANLAALRERVRAEGAEIGIALDGDADRVGVVDARGRILWGDQLMILLGRKLLEEQPGATFIAEVKCSQALFDELSRAGGKPLMWKVGHSLIKAKMQELGAALGGEMSGHIFFAHRYLGFDDGVYAGARMLELLSTSQQPLSALYDTLPVMVNTPEIRIECSDDSKFAVVERITERLRAHPEVRGVVDVDGVRAQFGDGWGLVRASNTQPALVLRCEAASAARLAQIRALLESEIGQAIGHPPVPASHG
jgi:phosphomannomutase/phosphoglucomutase